MTETNPVQILNDKKISSVETSRRDRSFQTGNSFSINLRLGIFWGRICAFYCWFKKPANPLVLINGLLFFAYGLFMVWQTKKAKEKMDANL